MNDNQQPMGDLWDINVCSNDLIYNISNLTMRGSPINHIRRQRYQDQGSSPFRANSHLEVYSPDRLAQAPANNYDSEYWRHIARKFEADNLSLNEELLAARRMLATQDQLDEKIEVLLAQNSHLADENENFINIIQDKRRQMELWKSKLEGQQSAGDAADYERRRTLEQLNLQDHEYQNQVERLLSENSGLHDQMQEMENLQAIEINSLKNRYENEAMNQIQNLKRSQYGSHQLQELNIRKLKDMLEEKEFDSENIQREAKLENQRLNGEINYLKNEIKKIEHQKDHELDLIRTEHDNNRSNLIRTHAKNEDELRTLHETKIRRLMYDIEEKKHQIEDFQGKLKKGGKENELELNQMVNEKSKLRQSVREGDNQNQKRVNQITKFYENSLNDLRDNNSKRQGNLISFYDSEIVSLKEVITAKQEEIQRLLKLNSELKINQEARLSAIKSNNDELKRKVEQIVLHYEREIELMKIKVAQLYEADLEALRTNMRNRFANHSRERENMMVLLKETRGKLAREVQDRLDQRKDYETRLDKFRIEFDKEHQRLMTLLAGEEERYKLQTSQGTLKDIKHGSTMEDQTRHRQQIQIEKRELEKQIDYKNKEIEKLNERVQLVQGFAKREAQKLEEQIATLKENHKQNVGRQDKEQQEWNSERSELKEKAHVFDLKVQTMEDQLKENDQKAHKEIEEKRLIIARRDGQIEELLSKVGILDTQKRVEASNVEKTQIESESLMNQEKSKFLETKAKQIKLRDEQFNKINDELKDEIGQLRKQNEILRDNHDKARIREADLMVQNSDLLDSVNKRNALEEHVINIGLSNNYFKNVAEIFKRNIE